MTICDGHLWQTNNHNNSICMLFWSNSLLVPIKNIWFKRFYPLPPSPAVWGNIDPPLLINERTTSTTILTIHIWFSSQTPFRPGWPKFSARSWNQRQYKYCKCRQVHQRGWIVIQHIESNPMSCWMELVSSTFIFKETGVRKNNNLDGVSFILQCS